ncbi:uncharacterized protein LOC113333586 [Papaver somniferum]|uniref:uncharacterized protein LOC113333586 n=1 Tax=Papaver somniferum TaxID=3469 RepID=UPI000E6F53B0|nr:uncharacterized protein LOC113333586 [Papaver somniferum]
MVFVEGAWDLNFARSLKENEVAEVVNLLQVIGDPNNHLSLEDSVEDEMHWKYGLGKGFSVANSYSALESHGFLCFPDKQLWNPKAPLKVEFLAWNLCYNGSPTLDYLHNAGLVQDAKYLFCNQHTDTNAHLFLHCQTTYKVWSFFLDSFGIKWVHSCDVKRTLWEWKNRKGKKMLKKIWGYFPFAIWWTMWRERNNRLHKNMTRNVDQLIIQVKCLLFQWAINTDVFSGFSLSTLICNWDVVINTSM